MNSLIGKTIKDADVDGFGIKLEFSDGTIFIYDASDGGYSSYEIIEVEAPKGEDK